MPNLWRQFADLLPESPLLIGTVHAVHVDHSVTVVLLDGGHLRVQTNGQIAATTGQRVFVRAGEVIGPAPSLPVIDIDF
jgi:hypothetical protein